MVPAIEIKLLGIPSVQAGGKPVNMTLKKAEAILYFMAVEISTTRDTLCRIFWPDSDTEYARRSLRNALYLIRKHVAEDLLTMPNHSSVHLNKEAIWRCDLWEMEPVQAVTREDLTLLSGFSFKEDEFFQEWLVDQQRSVQQRIFEHHKKIAVQLEEDDDYVEAAKAREKMTLIDAYDEENIRALMSLYLRTAEYNHAIEVYQRLMRTMKDELGVVPDSDTTRLYDKILELKGKETSQTTASPKTYFFGRYDELTAIEEEVYNLLENHHHRHVLITGEAGIGKTTLVERVVSAVEAQVKESGIPYEHAYGHESGKGVGKTIGNSSGQLHPHKLPVKIMRAAAYPMEHDLPYRIFRGILREMLEELGEVGTSRIFGFADQAATALASQGLEGDERIRYEDMVAEVSDLLSRYAQRRNVILIFEDLHWGQTHSINLLLELIREHLKNVMVVMTSRDVKSKALDFMTACGAKEKWLLRVPLARFSAVEARQFLKNGLRNSSVILDEAAMSRYIEASEGNTLLLREYLDLINEGTIDKLDTLKFEELMQSKLIGLSEPALRVADVAALFMESPDYEAIQAISAYEDVELVDLIEALRGAGILEESVDGERLIYHFTHQKLKDYLAEQISATRRRILHKKIADYYEHLYAQRASVSVLPYVIHHSRLASDARREYRYRVIYGRRYLDRWHEVFSGQNTDLEGGLTLEDKIMQSIDEARSRLDAKDDLIASYDHEVFYMRGRRAIREGRYADGLEAIDKAIRHFEIHHCEDLLELCLLQKIYYAIQTGKLTLFDELLSELGHLMGGPGEPTGDLIHVFWRLKGLHATLSGDSESAQNYLMMALQYLEPLTEAQPRAHSAIAATLNYLAMAYESEGRYDEAFHTYTRALEEAELSLPSNGLALILTNLSLAKFRQGRMDQSLETIVRAVEIFELTKSIWGRAKAEAHLARLIDIADIPESVDEHLCRARDFAQLMGNPYEIRFVQEVEAEIRSHPAHLNRIET
ncbi:AAA family ATPase [Acidaminobacter hydrogenoformans]|uniref:DNA-binding transcriptional activator of the SARP family n=1 Tax=Acidaminobacter hydrogenoformans DSM 2784 TaxID=1120920 RepID=A0A1G5RWD3_9FIRM|nr:AAA family ATPase [Acidaminobacter hydrogenoformans]SCZ78435.1 DNA-binding transcriptional activator of the SARP family [Acidaminobacter hydrogenoformans DSM 2784]